MNRSSLFTLLLSLSLGVSALTHAAEYRPWTDKATGKSIEATMLSADRTARTVTIQRKDGKQFTLPVDRLVEADLAYIRQNLSAPAAPPAAPVPAPTAPASPGAPTAAPAPAVAKPATPAAPVGQPAPARPAIVVMPAKKFKHPAGNAIMSAVQRVRPRTLMNAAGFAALKGRMESDPVVKKLYESLKATGEKIIELPELVQVRGEAAANNNPGAKAIFRMSALGTLNYLDGDPRWKDFAARELVSIASFTNWHPDEAEVCAEFVWGMSIGYDLFRSALNDAQAKKVRDAIVQLGMDALTARLKGEPMPATVKRPEPGTTAEPSKAPAKKAARKTGEEPPPDTEDMISAAALLIAAISLVDEEPNTAGPSATVAAKVFGEGIKEFAPDGIWPEGIIAGDDVLDVTASLIMTLRAATGQDFGFSLVEGLPQAAYARMHLTSPASGIFNYGDAEGNALSRSWVTSFLTALYGNPGVPALKVPGPASPETQYMNLAGLLLYHNPHIAGFGTPEANDAKFAHEQVATLRSAWNDPKAMFVGIKGGDNARPGGQLDLGSFVLDAGGVRWGVDLGTEADRVLKNRADPKKFEMYREGTLGQNTWRFTGPAVDDDKKKAAPKGKAPVPAAPQGSQPLDATAQIVEFSSTPERGLAIVDLSDAYSQRAKEFKRGVMLVRGPAPYVIMQDEMEIKSVSSPEWIMHTRAEVTTEGNKATLKSNNSTLTMTVISPPGAAIFAEDAPEPTDQQLGSLKGVKVIKIPLRDVKGEQRVVVTFAQGEGAPTTVVPLAEWAPKKR